MDIQFNGNKSDAVQLTLHNIIILTGPMTVEEYKTCAKNLLSKSLVEVLSAMTASLVALEIRGLPLFNPLYQYSIVEVPAYINN